MDDKHRGWSKPKGCNSCHPGSKLVACGPSKEEFCSELRDTLLEDMFFLQLYLKLPRSKILALAPKGRSKLIDDVINIKKGRKNG